MTVLENIQGAGEATCGNNASINQLKVAYFLYLLNWVVIAQKMELFMWFERLT